MGAIDYLRAVGRPAASLLRSSGTPGDVAVLQRRWSHHAIRSGYAPAAQGLGLVIASQVNLLPFIVARHGRTSAAGNGCRKAAEVDLLMRVFHRRKLLVVDGDFSFPLMAGLDRSQDRTVIPVLHQPVSDLSLLISQAEAGSVQGAICVARCQIPIAERLVGAGRAIFVPHGVDCSWFTPGHRSSEPVFVCTGVHRRDFQLLERIAAQLRAAAPRARVCLIAPAAWLPASLDCSNLEVRTDVSDEELREAYRSAWGLLMPITDATANNSILEAAACGTPIIATDIGGVRDYVPESAGLLCRGDADTYVDAVRQLIDQPSLRDSLGASARRNAETLAWPGVRAALLAAICEIDWCSRSDGKTSATWTTLRTR